MDDEPTAEAVFEIVSTLIGWFLVGYAFGDPLLGVGMLLIGTGVYGLIKGRFTND